ncbi:rab GTPase-binding effector protein 1-like, partial [Tropilaelaps mercedesae]
AGGSQHQFPLSRLQSCGPTQSSSSAQQTTFAAGSGRTMRRVNNMQGSAPSRRSYQGIGDSHQTASASDELTGPSRESAVLCVSEKVGQTQKRKWKKTFEKVFRINRIPSVMEEDRGSSGTTAASPRGDADSDAALLDSTAGLGDVGEGSGEADTIDDDVLESFRARMAAEFDVQRAALMQMFMAKEDELKAEQEKNFALTKQIEEFIGPAGLDLDESMRNAQKQTVLLRSVVKPMEDEIEEYKSQIKTLTSELGKSRADCDNKREGEKREKEDLSRQISDAKSETQNLAAKIDANESLLANLSVKLSGLDSTLRDELNKLRNQLAELQWQNRQLSEDNDRLLARHCSKMEQRLATDGVKLPDVFEKTARMVEHDPALASALQGLEFEYLKLHERMVESTVIWENADEKLHSQVARLKEEQSFVQNERRDYEASVNSKLARLNGELAALRDSEKQLQAARARVSELELVEPLKNKFEKESHELRRKVLALQKDLDNSEAVQKDFVKLSQSLQVELEKLRVCDGEVRFQHPDDVNECNGCKKPLAGVKKMNCNHCGRIFCQTCVSKIIQSGPNRRSFNVCAVCHTLLDQKSAPYFSTQ